MSDSDFRLTKPPSVTAQMGIRRPPSEVFAAFVDPTVTTRFWIEDSSGRLEVGVKLRWTMNSDGAGADVVVIEVETDERIGFDWGADNEYTRVELRFRPWGKSGTHVTISETGLSGSADDLVARVADSTGGFTMVLCSLKALLEHDIELDAVTDRAPTA